jgi:hypothetical protein
VKNDKMTIRKAGLTTPPFFMEYVFNGNGQGNLLKISYPRDCDSKGFVPLNRMPEGWSCGRQYRLEYANPPFATRQDFMKDKEKAYRDKVQVIKREETCNTTLKGLF